MLADSAYAQAAQWAVGALPRETGGLLLGWHVGADVVVSELVVIKDPSAGHYHYARRHQNAQAALEKCLGSSRSDIVGYVGEWHTHPLPSGPSGTDYDSLAGVVAEGRHTAGMVVFAVEADRTVTAWGAIGRPGAKESAIQNVDVVVEPVVVPPSRQSLLDV